jgi:hypothetical protein
MPAFRRVEGTHAGPQALGILVPPGPRTFVILRPRAVEWDLLPVSPEGGARFREFGRDEAVDLARRVHTALCDDAAAGYSRLEPLAQPAGYHLGGVLAGFLWLVCRRLPRQAYRPVVFATLSEALHTAHQLDAFLCPAADADQEYYFNTQNFTALSPERR